MNASRLRMLLVCLVVMTFISPIQAEIVTMDEALNIANNWIALVLHTKGDWGGSESAEVAHIQEFKRAGRTLGYYCEVKPTGFVMVSLLKGLAPIKAYSEPSQLNPGSDEGPADLLKLKMEQMLNAIEKRLGPLPAVRTMDVENSVEIDHRSTWEVLDVDKNVFRTTVESRDLKDVYEPGEILLSTNWHQGDPYNRMCPVGHNGCDKARCAVGCVATAGAQIMRHWCWPPYWYYWPNIPDAIDGNSPQEHIDAVSYLCKSVGEDVDMDYCSDEDKPCLSSSNTYDMEGVFESSGYSEACNWVDRTDYTTHEWWAGPGMIRDQINVNRPIQYRILGHSIVCDGWQTGYQVHMNYGWANSYNMWYSINGLYQVNPDGTWEDEYMVKDIHPSVSLSSPVAGLILLWPAFPYRYFDRDCSGGPATFQGGQYIQFMHNIVVTATNGDFRFNGTSGNETRLYTRGDKTKGVRIDNGTLMLMPGGSMTLYK